MATYLYGLLLADNASGVTATPKGIGGTPVRVLACGELAAIVSTTDAAPSRSVDNAFLHDHVLTMMVRAGTTIAAVRFGQQFDDDAACCREVASRATRVGRLLRDANGCVEMRVVVRLDDDPSPLIARSEPPSPAPSPSTSGASAPGRAYLESRRPRPAPVLNVALRDALGPLLREEKVEAPDWPAGVTIAHLIKRDDEVKYRVAIATLPGLADASVMGPFALYSFAEPES